eukprot:TRINITY_DN12279_c0_g1_i1.p1 TRINITY_DN12279_c0_g1~~TRINITY_DN12279_c0_g1_i1.p1  ORF type:complete len:524 (+),score=150.50 TRINITY_DN12279_c0_g1_i1:104-1675(+)
MAWLPPASAVVRQVRCAGFGAARGMGQGRPRSIGEFGRKGMFELKHKAELNSDGRKGPEMGRQKGMAEYWREPEITKQDRESRPDSGAFVMMRRMSELERDMADSNVDFRIIREEQEFLKTVLREVGIKVLMAEPDEASPFSSRLGRYATGLPAYLLLADHPDGLAGKAHQQIKQLLQQHKIFLPPMHLTARRRKDPLTFDMRDLVIVQGLYLSGARDETSDEVFSTLSSIVKPEMNFVNRDDPNIEKSTLKVINCGARGINVPLSQTMACIDGHCLVVDASNPAAIMALDQSGLTLTGLQVVPAPPFTTECMWLDTSLGKDMKSTVLVPGGFPEVEEFVRELTVGRCNVITLPFSEHLKMGVRLRELVLLLKPLYEGSGASKGTFFGGRRNNFQGDKSAHEGWRAEMKFDTYEAGQWGAKAQLGQPQNPFDYIGWLCPPDDHPWVKQKRAEEDRARAAPYTDLGKEIGIFDQYHSYTGLNDLPGLDPKSKKKASDKGGKDFKRERNGPQQKRSTPWGSGTNL